MTEDVTSESHIVSETMEPGLPIMCRNKGGFCLLCGDYIRHVDRESEEKTIHKGCDSCRPSYKKKYADEAVIGGLEFK